MYEVADDTYCYPGTTILKNKLDIQEQDLLDQAEAELTHLRAGEPMPDGDLGYAHYRAIHHHLFQDVYAWAGEPRMVRISKGGNPFCFPENIERQANKLFAELARKNHLMGLSAGDFAKATAHFLSELNVIHAFRDGNGRAQLTFLLLLAETAGHPIDAHKIDPAHVMSAMIESFAGTERPLEELLLDLIST